MKLFQVAMLLSPTKAERDAGGKPTLIGEPSWVVAASEQMAGMLVGRSLAAEYVDKLERIEVIIRPF